MAIYFELIPRCDPEHGAMTLTDIDAGICQFLGVPCDDTRWFQSWYEIVGFRLACGQSFECIRRDIIGRDLGGLTADVSKHNRDHVWCMNMVRLIQFLDDNYIVQNWAGR